jgi:hypothetical protein
LNQNLRVSVDCKLGTTFQRQAPTVQQLLSAEIYLPKCTVAIRETSEDPCIVIIIEKYILQSKTKYHFPARMY